MTDVTSRREFVARGSSALFTLACAPAIFTRRDGYDVVIRNGNVFNGLGTAAREADVAIRGDRIVAIGAKLRDRGREEVDARGLAVAPGFIDIHSHGDGNLTDDPRAESIVRQGVTTIVVGADGSSRATGAPERGFGAYFDSVGRLGAGPNLASMVGLGSVRGAVVGDTDRAATADQIAHMVALVERALADGACGASSGLEYTPGAFASIAELTALCRPLARRGLPYATHMRNEDDRLIEAIDESIAVARGAKCPLQISHLKTQGPRNWPKLDMAFARIATARAEGIDVMFDRYPYVAYATGLTNLFPVWSRDGGTAGFFARLDEPATAEKMKAEALGKVELIGGWDNIQISSVRVPEDRDVEGKRLGAHAGSKGLDPYDYTLALLRHNRADVGILGFAMSEDNLDRLLAHPVGMVCSDGGGFAADGPTRRGSPHPRGAGTFARVLGRYVRERRALSLESAIQKMTSMPAARVRLPDRGQLTAGYAADVVVFDPALVSDTATFDMPFQYPTGISLVMVNGTVALRDGLRHPDGTGRPLRAS